MKIGLNGIMGVIAISENGDIEIGGNQLQRNNYLLEYRSSC